MKNKFNWWIRLEIVSTLISKHWIFIEWVTSNEKTINRHEIFNRIILNGYYQVLINEIDLDLNH